MSQFERTARPSGDIRALDFVCPCTAGYDSQDMVKINDTIGQVKEDVVFGAVGVLEYHIEKTMALKKTGTGESFNPGDRVYWDPSTGTVTPTGATGLYWVGIAVEPATETASEVMIDLKGDKATLYGTC